MFIGHTCKFLCIFKKTIFVQFSFYVNCVQTNFIVSHVQLIYIVFTTMFIRHTCFFLSFSPQYFYRNFSFLYSLFFFETLVIQTNFIVSHLQLFYIIFYYNVYRSNVKIFEVSSLCIFYRNKLSLMKTPIRVEMLENMKL